MHRIILFVVLTIFYTNAFAQQTSSNQVKLSMIAGKVIDSSSKKPVEYATITAIDQHSKKPLRHAITNANGNFKITGLGNGTYLIRVDIIGYQSTPIDSIAISDSQYTVLLNPIVLHPSNNTTLTSIVITSKTPTVENKVDKTVYNVANDITAQGGVAVDVLKKIPQVTVDIDGNVELEGDQNVRFLINGKPSSAFGNDLTDALASIPASQIKSIEVITSPGAKYDAQGTGGIINIILKDSKIKGVNGSISLSAGSRLENSSVNLNIRRSKFDVTIFFSGNAQLSSRTPNSQNRLSMDTAAQTSDRLLQNGYTDFERNGYQSGIGFDWNISKKDNITATLGYSYFSNHSSGLTNEEEITQDENATILSDIYSFRNSDSRFHIHSIDGSFDYKKKFKKEGEELEFLYSSSAGTPYNSYVQTQTYSGQSMPYIGSLSNNPGTDIENDISLDYSYPIHPNFLIETGVKTIFQNINSTAEVSDLDTSTSKYVSDTTQSYGLNYKMKIYAGYISATFPLFHYINVKGGMRYEYTNVNIDFPNTTIPSYNSIVPSLILSHDFNKINSIKIAYTHRIERPNYNELNPFTNLSDPYNITTGNPLLQPEIGNNFELGYNKNLGSNGNIYIALLERINSDDIKPYTTFYPTYTMGDSTYNNVSVTTRRNIGKEYNSGIIVSVSVPIKNKLNLRSNLQMIQQRNVDSILQSGVTIGYKLRLNLNAGYQFSKTLSLELFGNYNSAVNSIQGRAPQLITYTFACRKQIWNKKGSLGITVTNPFNQYINQVTTINTANYTSYNVRQVPYRSFGISFTYKFGKLEFKKTKEDDTDYIDNPPN